MLNSLHIENIAVIQRAEVDFAPGLNVLTGETGAGKSIVIDALGAALGGRTSRELLRSGADHALVTACFDLGEAEDWCRENGVDTEDGELLLQRRLSGDGKSSARVNGIPVTASQLRELGSLLLDIHGQNDGRQLLDERRHGMYLDRFGVPEGILEAYRQAYEAYRGVQAEVNRLQMDDEEKERLEETLRHRVEELDRAKIVPGEEGELSARRDLLRHAEKLTEQLDAAYQALYGDETSAVSLCGEGEYAARRGAAWSPDLEETAEKIHSARLVLEDAAERIREKQSELDFSPEEYDRLEERLALLRRLEKKYGRDEKGLANLLEESRQRLEELEYAGDRLVRLEKELAAARERARRAGEELTAARRQAGRVLEQQVERQLRDLSMPAVQFFVSVDPAGEEPEASGMDTVRFTMSANAGEEPGPVNRIASGGELSRIMLALKNVFAEKDQVPTLVFDEIDAGVSGVAAQRVGEKLAVLSRTKQVLCVTHLPQIAALADRQLLVEKQEENGRTYTRIRPLDEEGRRRELARLQSGELVTESVLAGAGELLEQAKRFRDGL